MNCRRANRRHRCNRLPTNRRANRRSCCRCYNCCCATRCRRTNAPSCCCCGCYSTSCCSRSYCCYCGYCRRCKPNCCCYCGRALVIRPAAARVAPARSGRTGTVARIVGPAVTAARSDIPRDIARGAPAAVEAVIMRPVCPVMSAVPSGPPTRAPARTPSRPPPRVVPGIVPAVEAEAPAPAAERERRAPCSPVGTCPAVIPRVYINRSAPCPEHRSDVLGFHPDLVTGNDDVVECRVVGRSIGETAAIAEIIVTRRHPVCRRLEAPQAPCIGAFVRIGYDILVGVRTVFVILVLRSGGLRLRDTRLPFGPAASAAAFSASAFACCFRAMAVLSCSEYKSSLAYPDDA